MIRRLVLLVLLLAAAAAAFAAYTLFFPSAGTDRDVFVNIAPGTSTRGMARLLAQEGVIGSEWQFLLARAVAPSKTLQAGEYRFERSSSRSVWDVFRKIERGDIFYHELRVPEGSNLFEIAAAIEELGLMKRDRFLTVARDPALVRDLAPEAPTLEGYLFPSTYRLTRQTTPQQIAREMVSTFRKVWSELGGPPSGVNRLVTIASLVEKETAVPEERKLVASVYQNRLRIGMKLDCDPTTIYAALLEGKYRGVIYRSNLESTNPYNTYRHPGLPPGPIANPGRASLEAALHPAETSYLYFVAKAGGTGAHVFSESLAQHNAAVADYRHGAPR